MKQNRYNRPENRDYAIATLCELASEIVSVFSVSCDWEKKYLPWKAMNPLQKQAMMDKVYHIIYYNHNYIEDHQKWYNLMTREGWKYGLHYNPHEKTHPELVDFDKLPEEAILAKKLLYTVVRMAGKLLK